MTDYITDPLEELHETHQYACQCMKVTSNRMNAPYNHLHNSLGFQEGDKVWLYHLTQIRGVTYCSETLNLQFAGYGGRGKKGGIKEVGRDKNRPTISSEHIGH
jgi:hypothetical protein